MQQRGGRETSWRAAAWEDTLSVCTVNLCLYTWSRNTLIDTLVWNTADSCKQLSHTHTHARASRKYKQYKAQTRIALKSNIVKPFSGFAWGGLNAEYSLNINSGHIKAELCPAVWRLSCCCCVRAARVHQGAVWQRRTESTPRASPGLLEHNPIDHRLPPSSSGRASSFSRLFSASVPCGTQQGTRWGVSVRTASCRWGCGCAHANLSQMRWNLALISDFVWEHENK